MEKNKLSTSHYKERAKSNHQCGGTATLILDKLVGKVILNGAEKMSKWSWSALKGCKNRKVTIVTAYHVYKNNLSTVRDQMCWLQQWKALCVPGTVNPDPRKQLFGNCSKFIEERLDSDEELILCLDANEERKPDN
eukprot:6845744-Ditylum_brightwellii.AAC.1